MTEVHLRYFNFEHGGDRSATDRVGGGAYDFTGLVRVLSQGRPAQILVMGEGDRYSFNGGAGAWGAARAIREAGGPSYTPLIGSLPRDWGYYAPVMFVDQRALVVHHWYEPSQCDFAARNRNLLVASLPGRDATFHVIAVHGDIHSGAQRLADARELARFANPEVPCAILGDFNCTLSGPLWEPRDLNDPQVYPPDEPWRLAWRTRWQPGPPHQDTDALDFLCGSWEPGRRDPRRAWLTRKPGRRRGGIGFASAADLARDPTPTQLPRANGRQPTVIDHILLNAPFAQAMIPGSYHVHQPVDPANPDSDHLSISVTLDI